jgi:PTS system N-acetylgalactosamine-specific IIA component
MKLQIIYFSSARSASGETLRLRHTACPFVVAAVYVLFGEFMTNLIVIGHGGFGSAIRNALGMLVGETEGVIYVDFNKEDDLQILIGKIDGAIAQCGGDILFACDIAGGSPFRQCAIKCIDKAGWMAVAGLNVSAYSELVYNLDMPVAELLELGMEVTRSTVMRFPENPGK